MPEVTTQGFVADRRRSNSSYRSLYTNESTATWIW